MNRKRKNAHCYKPEEWKAYQAGVLGESEQIKMEEHLLVCMECMETYLSLIEESVFDENLPKLSEEFTEKLLSSIENEKRWQKASVPVRNISSGKKDKEVRNNRVNLFVSYCAAAGIAMFFWVGGYFDHLAGVLTKEAENCHAKGVSS
ncbi:MAG: hypothetical protein GX434_13650 [Peptococcaceae bacterium]|nr:hypothetical protein [Peptococcaceae bacterium]